MNSTSAGRDSPSDLESPFPLFTENIFSPSFIPKQPRNQRHSFPSTEEQHSCDGGDSRDNGGDILIRLLDLQTRISNLVKNLHEGNTPDEGSSNNNDNCKDVLGAGKSLIALLDDVSVVPSRRTSPFSSSEPTSPLSSGSSSTRSASSYSYSFSAGMTIPNNILILSLSSCYATLLHAHELLVESMQQQQQQSHSYGRKYYASTSTTHTPLLLLSPASSVSSSMSSSDEQQQGYFFFNNNSSSGLESQAPDNERRYTQATVVQMMQKLKHALQRCTVRMGRAVAQSQGQGQGSGQGRGQGSTSKKRKQQQMSKKAECKSKSKSDDDDVLVMGLSRPELIEMGWGDIDLDMEGEDEELFVHQHQQQQQPFAVGYMEEIS